jgi:hypothetical protein
MVNEIPQRRKVLSGVNGGLFTSLERENADETIYNAIAVTLARVLP